MLITEIMILTKYYCNNDYRISIWCIQIGIVCKTRHAYMLFSAANNGPSIDATVALTCCCSLQP